MTRQERAKLNRIEKRRHDFKSKTDCSNYTPDGTSKEGSACIWPWCDYCSFWCSRKES